MAFAEAIPAHPANISQIHTGKRGTKEGGMGRDTCRRQRKGRGGRGRVLWDESHCYHEGKKMAFSAFSVCSSHIKMTKTINSGQG